MNFNFDLYNVNFTNNKVEYYDLQTAKVETKSLALTRESFHKHLDTFDFKGYYDPSKKTNKVEDLKTMPFSYHYYYLTASKGLPPSPQEFVDSYINTYIDSWTNKKGVRNGHFKPEFVQYSTYKTFSIEALKGRMLRAYNSFNRELDLFLYMNDTLGQNGFKVEYDLNLDTRDGVDLLVGKGDFNIGIASYIDSFRANAYKARKDRRQLRTRELDVNIINFKAELWGENKNVEAHGDVLLYSDKAMSGLRKDIMYEYEKEVERFNLPAKKGIPFDPDR